MHTASLRISLPTPTFAALFLLAASAFAADNYYLQHNQFSPHHWESVGTKFGWHAEPDGSDFPVDFFVQKGAYFNNGWVLRTIDGEADKFDGRVLTLSGGSLELRFTDPERNSEVGELVVAAEGSTIENGLHTGPSGLRIGLLTLHGTLGLGKANKDYRTLRLHVDKLAGKGDLRTVPVGGVTKLSITDATGYTGTIVHQLGKLDFDAPLATPGALNVLAGATLILDQPVTFSAVTLNGVALRPGTLSFAELEDSFPGTMAPHGSGSITVKPNR